MALRSRIALVHREDLLGKTPTDEIGKRAIDKILGEGHVEAAGMVLGAVEEFATELSGVASQFFKLMKWKHVQMIVVSGGLRESRVGSRSAARPCSQRP